MYAGARSGICQLWKRSRGRTLRMCVTTISLTSRLARGIPDSRTSLVSLTDTPIQPLISFFLPDNSLHFLTRHFSTEPIGPLDRYQVLPAKERRIVLFVLSSLFARRSPFRGWASSSSWGWLCNRWGPSGDRREEECWGSVDTSAVIIELFRSRSRSFRFAPLSLSARGPIVILRACSLASLCIVVGHGRPLFVKGNLARWTRWAEVWLFSRREERPKLVR